MRRLFLKSSSCKTLMFLILLWVVADCSSSPKQTKRMERKSTTSTAPPNVANVTPVTQNESSITLQWNKVDSVSTYLLQREGAEDVDVSDSPGDPVVHVVSGLTAGKRYRFTLFSVANGLNRSGYQFTAVTAPRDTDRFEPISQTETSITLEWSKVGDIDTYTLSYDGTEVNVTHSAGGGKHTVSNLTNATRYSFTLFTVFDYARSNGANIPAVTALRKTENFEPISQTETSITLEWNKVGDIDTYTLSYNGDEVNITHSVEDGKHTVSNLTSATRYSFTLFTVFDYARSRGINSTAVTAPSDTDRFEHINQTETSITLQWSKVGDIDTYTLSYNGTEVDITHSAVGGKHTVSGLTSATRYSFTLFTVFDYARSRGANIPAVTAPENPTEFSPEEQTETSITLRWKPVQNIQDYTVTYKDTEIINIIKASNQTVTQTISGLDSGTRYDFWIFSVFDYARSSGAKLTEATVPPQVSSVHVAERFVDRATLQWEDPNKGWEYELHVDDRHINIIPTNLVTYSVENLKAGTNYSFSITTLFSGLRSSGYSGIIVTKIDCSAVAWSVTNSSIQGTVEGLFSSATASNGSETHVSPEGKIVTFSGLYPGATYEISLLYETSSELYPECGIKISTIPPSIFPHCSFWGSGYSALIKWETPNGVWTTGELNINGKTLTLNPNQNQLIVDGLQPAKTYKVSVISKLVATFNRSSEPSVFVCSTDNRGVIGGSVVGVLLVAVLICVIGLLFLKKPDIIRRKMPFILESRRTERSEKTVSAAKFPDHFQQLSLDENRGFSQEYEALIPVGTGQTCKAAILPENREKNRFNILPYDWCRVKLNTSAPNETDYINASYVPGYTSSRDYIATQGPLPCTVVDFWRMIWEQKVQRVVMVTNLIEAGRTKCAQYWPEDMRESQYGDVLVSVTSELKEPSWTLRQFTLKQKRSSEERTVKHFHFAVWPDRGVPQGTEVLIQFRRIVRQDIESDGSEAPTVVHCSDGVGRTGTFIALDFLLQQLEKQQAVGIKDFLLRMRRHRSHMVQTESQYVFLHQCIMDRLQPCVTHDEHVYENDDTLYANTIRLEEII